ncbi:MAG: hypothetical protein ACQES5_07840 [Thermodesulfobacteriota bacterium]
MPSKIMQQIRESATSPVVRKEEGWTGEFRFKSEFIGFAGHFPDNAVLPAVVQFSLAVFIVREIKENKFEPVRVQKAKFSSVLGPEMPIKAVVNIEKEEGPDMTVSCRISGPAETASSFKMDLAGSGE